MRRGIQQAAAFLLFLSEGVLERPFCQFEIREAMALKKPMLLIHESDPRFGSFDFGKAGSTAPADLKDMLDNHESLPFRRRGYERDGMLQSLIERAGFRELLESARNASTTALVELATVPQEIGHFDLESFQDRPVQAELMELLVLPKEDQRFASCVLIDPRHGRHRQDGDGGGSGAGGSDSYPLQQHVLVGRWAGCDGRRQAAAATEHPVQAAYGQDREERGGASEGGARVACHAR
jgi:hypothetical protein